MVKPKNFLNPYIVLTHPRDFLDLNKITHFIINLVINCKI